MEPIQSFLNAAKLARKQSYKNLTLFPLLAPDGTKPDYLTLEQALERSFVQIIEMDQAGSVPELRLINKGKKKATRPSAWVKPLCLNPGPYQVQPWWKRIVFSICRHSKKIMAMDRIVSDTKDFRRDVDSMYIEGELIKNIHQKKGVP